MSFRCDWCNKTIWQTMFRVVTKRRDKLYEAEKVKYVKGEKTTETVTTKGWEIVEELEVCATCEKELKENRKEVLIEK